MRTGGTSAGWHLSQSPATPNGCTRVTSGPVVKLLRGVEGVGGVLSVRGDGEEVPSELHADRAVRVVLE